MSIRIYRDSLANTVFFVPSPVEPASLNSLHAYETDAGTINVVAVYNPARKEIANYPHTDVLREDGSPAGATVAEVVNYLNSQFVASGTPSGTPPTITSSLTTSVQASAVFRYQITATESPFLFLALTLPSGLSCNPSTGVITGTVATPGNYNITITAVNSNGSDSEVLALEVLAVGPGDWADTCSLLFKDTIFQEYLVVTTTPAITQGSGDPFSFVFWVYLTELRANDFFSQGNANSNRYLGCNASGEIELKFTHHAETRIYRGGTLTPGVWQQVVVSYSAPGCDIYIDGAVQVVTVVSDTLVTPCGDTGEMRIARASGNLAAATWLNGYINEWSFWDVALSAGQATTLYNGGVTFDLATVPFVAGMQAWFLMGDGDTYPNLHDQIGPHSAVMYNMTSLSIVSFAP